MHVWINYLSLISITWRSRNPSGLVENDISLPARRVDARGRRQSLNKLYLRSLISTHGDSEKQADINEENLYLINSWLTSMHGTCMSSLISNFLSSIHDNNWWHSIPHINLHKAQFQNVTCTRIIRILYLFIKENTSIHLWLYNIIQKNWWK